jgi:hypothetical protein
MNHITMFLGEPVDVWARIQAHAHSLGFESAKEFLEAQQQPAEYQATNSLLKARLARIQKLAGLHIQEAA